jgi:hypothetical protein
MSQLVICRRVNLLVQVADWIAKRDGSDPRADADRHAERWELADPHEHEELANHAGMAFDPRAALQFIDVLWARAEHLRGAAA